MLLKTPDAQIDFEGQKFPVIAFPRCEGDDLIHSIWDNIESSKQDIGRQSTALITANYVFKWAQIVLLIDSFMH